MNSTTLLICAPMKNLVDGPGWSPDGGAFDKVGEVIYWSTGQVSNVNDGTFFRVGMLGGNGERFSQWSDEKRAEVLAQNEATWAANKAQEEEREKHQAVLRESAKAKLTEEEYNAVYSEGYDRS